MQRQSLTRTASTEFQHEYTACQLRMNNTA